MPRKKKKSSRRRVSAAVTRKWARCRCPAGSKKISTKGVGRGWACQSNRPKRTRTKTKTIKGRLIKRPFVKAVCR